MALRNVFHGAAAPALRGFGLTVIIGFALSACGPTVAPDPRPEQAPAQVEADQQPEEIPAEEVDTRIPDDGKVRVGIMLPLSGRGSDLGQALLDAAQLAVFDLADDRFVLLPRDTEGSPEGARRAMDELLDEGVQLVLGPLFSDSVDAARPAAAQEGVSIISFSTDQRIAGDGVYVMGFLPSTQVERVVGYASSQGNERFAVLAPRSAYGDAVVQAMADAVRDSGGDLVETARYPDGEVEISDTVRALASAAGASGSPAGMIDDLPGEAAASGLDALMIAEGGSQLQQIAPLLPFYDINPGQVQFLGTGLWDNPDLGSEPALVGGWFAATPPSDRRSFEQNYENAYGQEPPRLATLAYDASALASVLAQRAGDDGLAPYDTETLTNQQGFAGVDGLFRFLPDGRVERALAILEVEPGGVRVIDSAPSSFEPLVN